MEGPVLNHTRPGVGGAGLRLCAMEAKESRVVISGGKGLDSPMDIFVFFLLLPILEEAHLHMNFLGLL